MSYLSNKKNTLFLELEASKCTIKSYLDLYETFLVKAYKSLIRTSSPNSGLGHPPHSLDKEESEEVATG